MKKREKSEHLSRIGKSTFLLYMDHDINKEIKILKNHGFNVTIFINSVLRDFFLKGRNKYEKI